MARDRGPHLLAVATLAVSGAACAGPSLGAMSRLVSLSEREEARVGAEAMAELERNRSFITEGPLLERVRAVGNELAAVAPEAPLPYGFSILDAVEENASALPGGRVIVTRGLLLLCNTVDDLAGVLGHEIGHITARHVAARLGLARPLATLARLLRRAVAPVDEALAEEVGDRLPELMLAPYARAQEREANRLGISLAASAGFEPRALAGVLLRLKGAPEGRASTSTTSALFASHPSPVARAELIRALAAELERTPRPPDDSFRATLDGVTVGEGPLHGVRQGDTALLPAWGLALDFPAEWLFVATERGFIGVGPGGRGQLRVLVEDAEVARSQRAQLKAEPALVDWSETSAEARLDVVQATLRLGTPATVSRYAWVAFDGGVLAVVAEDRATDDETAKPAFARLVASVRLASVVELEAVEVLRLRLVEALGGEAPAALAARSDSAWSLAELARYNALELGSPLVLGQRVKVARREHLVCDRADLAHSSRCH